jgi:hypothetical protein
VSHFNPTTEQLRAIELFSTGRSIAIEAGAGAGKTSTLKLIAESTERQGQYVAFNKAIVTEAGAKMPSNITCTTAHALAYRGIITNGGADGRKFGNRLRNSARMKSLDIANRLGISPINVTITNEDGSTERKTLGSPYLAGLVMRSVTRFCQSADAQPDAKHMPYIEGIDIPPGARGNNNAVARELVPAMRAAWADISNPHGSLPFKHEHYLKLYQLSNPRIGKDFILFDEAQDANPVMVAIVAAQEQAQLVWVGDSQQQIYTFTGAVNALGSVPSDDRAFLTQSFRFGPAIAEVANRILDTLNAELNIIGTPEIDSRVCTIENPNVILSRTNAAAITALFAARAQGKTVHLVGGGKDIIAFARAAQALMSGRRTEHPELACFESWSEVVEYVEQDEQGGDLKLMVGIIERFGVGQIIDALDRMPREDAADLVVSTAHKAKGREWDRVQLAGDFPEEPQGEELRLLYVAVTRARFQLDIDAVSFLNDEEGDDVESPTDAQIGRCPHGALIGFCTHEDCAAPTPVDVDALMRLDGVKSAGRMIADTYAEQLRSTMPVYQQQLDEEEFDFRIRDEWDNGEFMTGATVDLIERGKVVHTEEFVASSEDDCGESAYGNGRANHASTQARSYAWAWIDSQRESAGASL